jgi:hypothetical protein
MHLLGKIQRMETDGASAQRIFIWNPEEQEIKQYN